MRTGKKVAVVGSGPAGLAAAAQLNRAGHWVTVFERADRIGGLLMYGIPNMKLDKNQSSSAASICSTAEGDQVRHQLRGRRRLSRPSNCCRNSTPSSCAAAPPSRAICRSRAASFKGIHFAMEFLHANTKSLLDSQHADGNYISRQGQGRDRHRRRRHRHRLRRHLDAARLPQPGAIGDSAQAAAGTGRRQSLAAMAQDLQARLRPGRSRRALRRRSAALPHPDQEIRRRRRPATSRKCTRSASSGSRTTAGSCREKCPAPRRSCPRSWCCWPWAFWGRRTSCSTSSASTRTPRSNAKAEHGKFQTNHPRRLRRRRHAPRPKPGRLGHQRRPRRRPGMRSLLDGRDDSTIVYSSRSA